MTHYAKTTEELSKEIANLANELRNAKKDILNVINTTKLPINKKITFAEWWDIFISRYSVGRVAGNTINRYQYSRLKLSAIENMPLYKITTEDVQTILDDILVEKKYRSAEVVRSNLHTCFEFAIKKAKFITENPVFQTVVPHIYPKKTIDELSSIQKKRLLEFCYSETSRTYHRQQVYKDILSFIFNTGVRLSEALYVSWSDWDGSDVIYLKGTKTPNAERIIILPPQTVLVLKRRYKSKTSSLIFPSSNNTPLHKKNVWRCCNKVLGTCPQSFRVTFASDAARSGVPPKSLQKHLGHRKIETTLKHYVRVNHNDLREAVRLTRNPFVNKEISNFSNDNFATPCREV